MEPYTPVPGKRHNVFILAFNHFPRNLIATAIGIASLSAPFVYNLLRDHGIDTFILGVLLTGVIIVIIPLSVLYLFTLLRAPKIQGRMESEAERELEVMTHDMEVLQAKEKKEEAQIHQLEQVIKGDLKVHEAGEEKTDERWDELTKSIRLQKETAETAAHETIRAAKQVKEIKDKGEVALTEYTTDEVKFRQTKESADEDRWKALDERLQMQDERSEERDKQQIRRDNEILQLLHEHEGKHL